ncbi:phosphatase PAP2 family protein [Rothia nasimurium]|uniref:phosphatase PAP2 family protein n=1 Tax=Rothia nasimurium TaxID=85336 RepID=UPI001F3D6056|nr:phosphatase PAP2 family protein [Rothia nasimurium]
MSFEKRDSNAVSGAPDDATEVLIPQAYDDRTVALPLRPGEDATEVLPTSQARATFTDDDATVVLAASTRPLPAPGAASKSASEAGSDPTQLLETQPSSRAAFHSEPQGEAIKAKLQAGAASSLAAAKTGFAAAQTAAQEAAHRVKKERAARAAAKARAQAAAPRPEAVTAHRVPQATYGATAASTQGRPRPGYPAQAQPGYGRPPYQQAHSGEDSPSGRLHMLTPSHIRQTRPSLWTLIQHFFAAGTLFCLLVAAFVFFITTPTGQELDEISFQEFSYQFMTYTQQTSTLLDFIPTAAGITAAIGLLFVLLWKHRFVPALVGIAIAAGANLTTQLLKNYIIVKPNLGIQEALGNSAPSGHTTFAAAAGLALFLASPKRFRPTVALISMVFTVAAGYSTVVNGWHRPADVVTAILVTGLWGVLGLVILRFMRSEELDMSDTQRSGLILVPLLSISGFFSGFCALALYWVTYTNPIPGSAFMAAICLIGAVAALTTSTQVALLRPQNKKRSAYRRVWAY